MSEHFIKEIEIKDYKLFKDFKAEGFGRVNLIGGKNNVGKTAFMEACYISDSKTREENLKHIIRIRYMPDILIELWKEVGRKYIDNFINEKIKEYEKADIKSIQNKVAKTLIFKSDNKADKKSFEKLYSLIVENELENELDNFIKYFDKTIEKFRIINGEPYCKKNDKFYNLNEFGDGLAKYISFTMLLLSNKDSIIFIDEIENGIHYTNFDKLWEIILTLSKEQNVQVFATTHSLECIQSYARVAKKLEDKEIAFIEMGINKYNKPRAIVMDRERFFDELEIGNEVRGW